MILTCTKITESIETPLFTLGNTYDCRNGYVIDDQGNERFIGSGRMFIVQNDYPEGKIYHALFENTDLT